MFTGTVTAGSSANLDITGTVCGASGVQLDLGNLFLPIGTTIVDDLYFDYSNNPSFNGRVIVRNTTGSNYGYRVTVFYT